MSDIQTEAEAVASAPAPAAQPAPQSVRLKPSKLFYTGTPLESYTIAGVSTVLSLISLGFYAPWAIGTAREYLYGRLSLNKKYAFAYKGNPVEMAVALGIAAVAILILLGLFHLTQSHGLSFLTFLVILAGYALFYAAVYASFYIRMRHISLNGRNFVPKADVLEYTKLALKRGAINFLTIGFKLPESDRLKWNFMVSRLSYSGGTFSSEMSASQARKTGMANMVSLWLPLLTGLVLVMMLATIPPEAAAKGAGNLLTFLTLLVTGLGFLGRATYRAAMWNLRLSTLRLGPIRFKPMLETKVLIRLQITNALLFFFTAGLAHPFILHRKMEFLAENVLVSGGADALMEA
jgi:uncharacterized membrane protein YjgN (DUF898 family)